MFTQFRRQQRAQPFHHRTLTVNRDISSSIPIYDFGPSSLDLGVVAAVDIDVIDGDGKKEGDQHPEKSGDCSLEANFRPVDGQHLI